MAEIYYNAPYLDPTEHSVLDHTGISGMGLDEAGHDLLDHTGLTGVGGEIVRTHQNFVGTSAALASGANLPWPVPGFFPGDDLLDLTDPFNPTVKVAGTYAIMVSAGPDPGAQAGKNQRLTVQVVNTGDATATNFTSDASTSLDGAGGGGLPFGYLSLVWYCTAGAILRAIIRHDIGSDTAFDVNMRVQRLS